jgi:uncharacterized membrane protein YfcA
MKAESRLFAVTIGALAAGITNGLLGAGGGIILIFVLAPALGGLYEKGEEFYKRRDLMAISLSVMLPVSAVSALRYGLKGMLDMEFIPKIILPAIIGGIIGGILLDKLKENFIMKLFAFLVIYSGLAMIVR